MKFIIILTPLTNNYADFEESFPGMKSGVTGQIGPGKERSSPSIPFVHPEYTPFLPLSCSVKVPPQFYEQRGLS